MDTVVQRATPTSPDPHLASPLVVDLDGTLISTDTLIESIIQIVRKQPWLLILLLATLFKGRVAFKALIASKARLSAAHLPYRGAFLDYLKAEKRKGRRIILATAAHQSIAERVASHLQLFDLVLASTDQHNLKGVNKLAAIEAEVGKRFVYAGDSKADLPIWKAAEAAILIGASPAISKAVRATSKIEYELPLEPIRLATWMKALRMHQWLKNLLLFVPVLTAFSYTGIVSVTLMGAFLSFSLAASATYIVNDLLDIESDRVHPRKRRRPFASGQIAIPKGLLVSFSLLAIALVLAAMVSTGFLLTLLLYLVLTSAYSWALKEYVLLDVILLGLLYTLRIFAGAVAAGVGISSWLLVFSLFIFLSLALIKRCSELVTLAESGVAASRGRDYRVSDLVILWPLGVGAALSSIVIFTFYISATTTQARYATPELLWLVAVLLIYWVSRLWIKTARGEMHDDPIVFAVRDFGSGMTILAMLMVSIAAHFWRFV